MQILLQSVVQEVETPRIFGFIYILTHLEIKYLFIYFPRLFFKGSQIQQIFWTWQYICDTYNLLAFFPFGWKILLSYCTLLKSVK